MDKKLGKLPARPNAVKFGFSTFFDVTHLPVPPASFGHGALVEKWYGLGNDKWGCCVFAGAAHEHMMWSMEGGESRARFTIADVLSDYGAVTGFDPNNPTTDQGTDMQVAASYRRLTGIRDATGARHKIDAYVSITTGSPTQLAVATYFAGAVGVGLQFPYSAMEQFDHEKPWDVVPGARVSGGHYVPCVGKLDNGNFLVVSWGRIQQMTPAFYQKYNDESVAYLSLEILSKSGLSPEGFNATLLRQYLKGVSS